MTDDPHHDSLHTRVAVLEVTVALMQSEFRSLRSTILNTGLAVVLAIITALGSGLIYFVQQKDELVMQLQRVVDIEEMRQNGK